MTTEAEYNAQETEREYGRLEKATVYTKLDEAQAHIVELTNLLKQTQYHGCSACPVPPVEFLNRFDKAINNYTPMKGGE